MLTRPSSLRRLSERERRACAHSRRGRALVCLLAILAVAAPSLVGDSLDEVRRRGELVWAADVQGGGPFVYPDEQDPSILKGFEFELAGMIAKEIGVRARFQQGAWDQLPLLLDRGMADVVINGYELTPARKARYDCSRPYFAFGFQLLSRKGSRYGDWSSLTIGDQRSPPRIAVLAGSQAESYVKERVPTAEIVAYENNTDAMQHVAAGLLDATVCDDCVAFFYADRFKEIRFAGRAEGTGYYVVLTKLGETRLRASVDAALAKIIADGRLVALYDRWNLAGRQQQLLLREPADSVSEPRREVIQIIRANSKLLLEAAGMTLLLSITSMPIAIALGVLVAVGRMYGPWPVRLLLTGYVELLRGTPLMLQLYAIFFLLPELGVAVPALAAAIMGLAINYSAYEAENYRAGLEAVPTGQYEAAVALGLSRFQAIRHVVLPQAVRIVIPPVTNDFIALFKDTSVCSVVTVVELTKQYNVLAQSTGAIVELAAVTAALYLLMSYPLAVLSRYAQERLKGAAQPVLA